MFEYFRRRKQRRAARDLLRHSRHVRNMREDVMAAEAVAALRSGEDTLRATLKARDWDGVAAASEALHDNLARQTPRRSLPALRENIEVIAVAVGVAMAFRTYFIQPFKIPTGSMQPTLYGITSLDRPAPGLTDRYPLKLVKWALTGEWYRTVRAAEGGTLDIERRPDGRPYSDPNYPADVFFRVAGKRYRIPRDARPNVAPGQYVPRGAVLWAGSRIAGDHVFVDKVRWNFFRPRRGQIMVFSTRGIAQLEEGLPLDRRGRPMSTHYIKRMSGMPGERVGIRPPDLLIDGEPKREPRAIARIAAKSRGYHGYELTRPGEGGVLGSPESVFELSATEYFALGDNTGNSRDSRYWGAVPRENLVGPSSWIYWPFLRFNRANGNNGWQLAPIR